MRFRRRFGSWSGFASSNNMEFVGSTPNEKRIQTLDFAILALSELRELLLEAASHASPSRTMHYYQYIDCFSEAVTGSSIKIEITTNYSAVVLIWLLPVPGRSVSSQTHHGRY